MGGGKEMGTGSTSSLRSSLTLIGGKSCAGGWLDDCLGTVAVAEWSGFLYCDRGCRDAGAEGGVEDAPSLRASREASFGELDGGGPCWRPYRFRGEGTRQAGGRGVGGAEEDEEQGRSGTEEEEAGLDALGGRTESSLVSLSLSLLRARGGSSSDGPPVLPTDRPRLLV